VARPNLNLGDVEPDPEVRNRYERAMGRNVQMPPPPPVEHPIVAFAQKILAPLGNFGNQERRDYASPPVTFQPPINHRYPSGDFLRSQVLGGQAATKQYGEATFGADPGGNDYGFNGDLPHDIWGALANMGVHVPMRFRPDVSLDSSQVQDTRGGVSSRGKFGNQERKDMAAPVPLNKNRAQTAGPAGLAGLLAGLGNFDPNVLPGYKGSPASRGESITGNITKQLTAADTARTEAFNAGDPLGVVKGILGTAGAVTPQPPDTSGFTSGVLKGAGFPENASNIAGQAGSMVLGLADTGGAGRYMPEIGKSRSLIRDTVTGKTEPTMFSGPDHAAKAEAAAAKLNATTGTAPDAGIAVPLDAQITGALRQVPTDVGTVVRRAAREMPDMTAQAMADAKPLRSHLDLALAKAKMPATDANAVALADRLLAQEKARPTVGNKNYQQILKALGVEKPRIVSETSGNPIDFGPELPKPVNVPASAEQTAANVGRVTEVQATQADILRAAIAKKEAALAKADGGPKLVATSPNETAIPFPPTKSGARSLAMGALNLVTDIPRSIMVISGIPAFRQGLPMMADAIARGAPHEIPIAFARSLASVVSTDSRMAGVTEGFMQALRDVGAPETNVRRLVSDPTGPLMAREEFGLRSALDRAPVVKNLNRAHPTFLNSLRVGMATSIAEMDKAAGKTPDWNAITDTVRAWSGRADLPGGDAMQSALSGIFFGPQLEKANWQSAANTLGSLFRLVKTLPEAGPSFLREEGVVSKAPLKTTDLVNIRTAAATVATGVGLMKIANQFGGTPIGVDPTKTDFGRITLPDGRRIDLWGPYNEKARLIARVVDFVQRGAQGQPVDYGQTTALDLLTNYARSKLNAGAPQIIGDVAAGETYGGVPWRDAYTSPDFNVNPAIPVPMDLADVINAYDLPYPGKTKSTGGQGGMVGALEAGLSSLGATVTNTAAKKVYDGLGKPEADPMFGRDPILQEFANLAQRNSDFDKDGQLAPPNTTIGSGKAAFKLPPTEADKYVQAVGEQRRVQLGDLIYSPEYQNMTQAQKEKAFKATQAKADTLAERQFLATGVIDSTDPQVIQSEAVAGFHAQGTNRNEAYWIALLDRAGKLTPEVAKAIDDSNVVVPGQRAPITVEEYRRDAPLVHEYLAHAPYGTDAHPIGTPADWATAAQAKQAQNVEQDRLIRSGVNPSIAAIQAKQSTLAKLTSMVQRSLFLNGASLANNQRTLLVQKYGTRLTRYLGGNDVPYTQESEAQYQDFPFGS
jgi:hypothetical protein